jgi:hypothetical protein
MEIYKHPFIQAHSQHCEKWLLDSSGLPACLPVRPLSAWNNSVALDGFSLNSIFEYFSKICSENSGFFKM